MPLGLINGGPFRPFSRAISARCSTPVRSSSATLPNSPTTSSRSWADDRTSRSNGGLTQSLNLTSPRRGKEKVHDRPGFCPCYRETLVAQRTQLINALRGHAAEFGVIAAKGTSQIAPLLAAVAAEESIPAAAKAMLALLGEEIAHLDGRLKELEAKLLAMHRANAISQLLATIPGIGPIIALTLAVEVDPKAFQSGRHLAAWLGLTPREHSTGGKQRLGGISRAGHERLRSLLVSGATAVIRHASQGGGKLASEWLRQLLSRKPLKLAA